MGLYVCTVSAWSVNSQGDTVKIAEHQSSPQTVRWVTKRKEASFVCPLLIISAVVISSARLGLMPFDESRKTNDFAILDPVSGCVQVHRGLQIRIQIL